MDDKIRKVSKGTWRKKFGHIVELKWGIKYYDKHGVIVEEWYDTIEERDTIFHTIHDPDNGVEYIGEDNNG